MLSGKMDRRISLEKPILGKDSRGQARYTYGTPITLWAQIKPVSDGEKYGSGDVKAYATHRFWIRYHIAVADLDPRWKLTYDGVVYDISGVKEIGRQEALEISAIRRAENG